MDRASLILLLHTSTDTANFGLARDGVLVKEDSFPIDNHFAELLSARLQEFFQATNYKIKDLGRIALHAGPGRFTGLRIGVTTANTLAYALGIPVVGVSGPVPGLQELLVKSHSAQPPSLGMVVPVYGSPPRIGGK